ncbi:MAG TPA: hypothetical protein PKA10_10455 [Selenomonadales bacterium]|nr:hypothetical protein [Selenomonadales bacterium]
MDRYITLIKALGIFAVVNGHLKAGNLGHIYYLFHIPLFFFLTGYLYKDKYSENPLLMVKQRLKTLYLPFILYGFSFLLLREFFIKIGFYSIDTSVQDSISPLIGIDQYMSTIKSILTLQYYEPLLLTFWFLVVLFEVSILFAFVRFISEMFFKKQPKEATFFIITILFLIGFRLTKSGVILPVQLDKALICLFFVNLGYIYQFCKEKILFKTNYAILAILALTVLERFGYVNIDLRKYTDPPYFVLGALLGIYVVFWIASLLSKYNNLWTRLLEIIGNNTLPIVALHIFAFKVVTYIRIKLHILDQSVLSNVFPQAQGIGWKLIYISAGLILPVLIGILIKKVTQLITKNEPQIGLKYNKV